MVAGVAIAFANRLSIPVWVVRVLFIVGTVTGGLGLVLYVACWAVLRSEDEDEPPAARFFSRANTTQSWMGIALIFLAAMFLLDRFTFLSRGVIWAGALLVGGVLLYFGQIPFPEKTGDSKEGVQRVNTESKPADVSPVSTSVLPAGAAPGQVKTREPRVREPREPKPPRERSILGQLTVGMMFVATGLLAILDLTTTIFEPTIRHYLALATVVLGVGLLVGSVWGRARYLILIAVVLVPTLLVTPLAGYWSRESFSTRPTTFAELQTEYSIDAGRLTVDLSELPWNGEEIELYLSGHLGAITLVVPHDVAISGSARVNVGQITAPGTPLVWTLGTEIVDFDDPGTDQRVGEVEVVSELGVGAIRIDRVLVMERIPQ